MKYNVNLGGQKITVDAKNKLDAERKAVRVALDNGTDRDDLLALSDDDVKVTRTGTEY